MVKIASSLIAEVVVYSNTDIGAVSTICAQHSVVTVIEVDSTSPSAMVWPEKSLV
jgi:hypothetical protein